MVIGGIALIGSRVEMFKKGKFGSFKCSGIIVDYYKNKSKGKHGSLTITKGQYLIDFGKIKCWHTMSDFKITNQLK